MLQISGSGYYDRNRDFVMEEYEVEGKPFVCSYLREVCSRTL
jgi:hypothetical protein